MTMANYQQQQQQQQQEQQIERCENINTHQPPIGLIVQEYKTLREEEPHHVSVHHSELFTCV